MSILSLKPFNSAEVIHQQRQKLFSTVKYQKGINLRERKAVTIAWTLIFMAVEFGARFISERRFSEICNPCRCKSRCEVTPPWSVIKLLQRSTIALSGEKSRPYENRGREEGKVPFARDGSGIRRRKSNFRKYEKSGEQTAGFWKNVQQK